MIKRTLLMICLIAALGTAVFADDIEDFRFINKLHQGNMSKNAIEEIEIFLKKYPNSKMYDSAVNLLAYNYYAIGNYEKSKSYFEKMVNSQFKKEAVYYLGMIAIKNNDFAGAENYIARLDNKSQLKIQGMYNIAEAYYQLENYPKAEEYYKLLIKETGKYYYEALLKLGIIYYENGDYMKSIPMLETYISEQKSSQQENLPLIYYMLGYSNEKVKDVLSARKFYEKIATTYLQSKYYYEAVYNLAKIYSQAKDYDSAAAYVEALKGGKYYYDGLMLLGELAYEDNKLDTAAGQYQKIADESNDTKVLFKLAVILIKTEKYTEAEKVLGKLKESEYNEEYYYYSFFINYKLNNYKKIDELTIEMGDKLFSNKYLADILAIAAESEYILKNNDKSLVFYQKLYEKETKDEVKKKALYRIVQLSTMQKNDNVLIKYFEEYKEKYQTDTEYKKDIYIIAAQYYIDKSKYKDSENIYKTYLKTEMDDTILRNLVAVLLKQDKFSEMEIYLKRLPDTAENTYLLGATYMNMHNYDRAEIEFKKVISARDAKYIEDAYLNLTDSQYINGRYDELIKYCNEYVERDYKKHLTKIQARKGAAFFKQKKYEEALNVYEALKEDKEIADFAYFMSAESLYNMKKSTEAIANYDYVINNYAASSYRKDSLYWTVNITYENKMYELALKSIEILLRDYPNSEYAEDATYYMANIQMEKNNVEEAIKGYEKVVSMTNKKELKESIGNRVITDYFSKGDYQSALRWTEKLGPSSLRTLWTGLIYMKTGKQSDGIKRFESIVNDADNGDKALYYLGDYYMEKKQYEKARGYFARVVDVPVSEYKDDAVLKMGYAFEAEGNYQKAIQSLLRIKLLYDNSPLQEIATLKVAEDYERLNDFENAYKYYIEFYTNYKTSQFYVSIVERLVIYHLNKQNVKSAEPYYQELLKLNKEKAEVYKKYFN